MVLKNEQKTGVVGAKNDPVIDAQKQFGKQNGLIEEPVKGGTITFKSGKTLVVRPLADLLEDKKPKKVLIVADGHTAAQTYSDMLGFDHPEWICRLTEAAALRGVAKLIENACLEAGIQVEIMQVSETTEFDQCIYKVQLALSKVEELRNDGNKSQTAEKKAEQMKEVEKNLSMAAELVKKAKAALKATDIIPPEAVEEELKKHDPDMVLHVSGCPCCSPGSNTFRPLLEKLGKDRLFILTTDIEPLERMAYIILDRLCKAAEKATNPDSVGRDIAENGIPQNMFFVL